MILLQRNKIHSLEDDVNDYVAVKVRNPNFPNESIPINSFLQHTSGLNDQEIFNYVEGEEIPSLEEYVKEFLTINGKLKGNWSKEKPIKYWYSNAGVTFLGYLIEQVSGQSFIEFVQKEIFDVLDIRTANWVAAKLDKRILVTNYE